MTRMSNKLGSEFTIGNYCTTEQRKIPLLENWSYLSYDLNIKQVGLGVLEITIGNC